MALVFIQSIVLFSRERELTAAHTLASCRCRIGLSRVCRRAARAWRDLALSRAKPGENGYGKNVTRRFADYLDGVKIVDDRKVFHSFRHTFIDRMTELNVHPAMPMALVGHYDQTKVDFRLPHFANSQHVKPLAELKATLDRFDVKLPQTF